MFKPNPSRSCTRTRCEPGTARGPFLFGFRGHRRQCQNAPGRRLDHVPDLFSLQITVKFQTQMSLFSSKLMAAALFARSLSSASALTPEQAAQLPPAVKRPVNFSKEINPIFEASCIKCHGRGRVKAGFRLDPRETLLKGGDTGPAIVPGRSADSLLIALVQGLDPDSVMPKKGSRLTAEQIGLLR